MVNIVSKKDKAEFAAYIDSKLKDKADVNNQDLINAAVSFAREENPGLSSARSKSSEKQLHRIADRFLSDTYGSRAQIDLLCQDRKASSSFHHKKEAASPAVTEPRKVLKALPVKPEEITEAEYKPAAKEPERPAQPKPVLRALPVEPADLSKPSSIEIRTPPNVNPKPEPETRNNPVKDIPIEPKTEATPARSLPELTELRATDILKGATLKYYQFDATGDVDYIRKALNSARNPKDLEGFRKDLEGFQKANNIVPADGNIRAGTILKLIEQNKLSWNRFGLDIPNSSRTELNDISIASLIHGRTMARGNYLETNYDSPKTKETISEIRKALGISTETPVYDGKLQAALLEFQVKNGLPIDGELSAITLNKLLGLKPATTTMMKVTDGTDTIQPDQIDATGQVWLIRKAISPQRSLADTEGFKLDLQAFQKQKGIPEGEINKETISELIKEGKIGIHGGRLCIPKTGLTRIDQKISCHSLMMTEAVIGRSSERTAFADSETRRMIVEVRRALGIKASSIFDAELEAALHQFQLKNDIGGAKGEINKDTLLALSKQGKIEIYYNEHQAKFFLGLLIEKDQTTTINNQPSRERVWKALFDESRMTRAANLELSLAESPHYDEFLKHIREHAAASGDTQRLKLCESLIEARAVGIDLPIRLARTVGVDELNQLIAMKKSPDWSKPLAVIAYPHRDHNGAFGDLNGTLLTDLIKNGYNVQYGDAKDLNDLTQNLESSTNNAAKKADLMIIAGHGSSSSINLGFNSTTGTLTKDSTESLNLNKYIVPNGVLMMHSCSLADYVGANGEAIGYKMSRELPGVTMIAYNRPANSSAYIKEKGWFSGYRSKNESNSKDVSLPGGTKFIRVVPSSNVPSLSILRDGKFQYGDNPLAANDPERNRIPAEAAY